MTPGSRFSLDGVSFQVPRNDLRPQAPNAGKTTMQNRLRPDWNGFLTVVAATGQQRHAALNQVAASWRATTIYWRLTPGESGIFAALRAVPTLKGN